MISRPVQIPWFVAVALALAAALVSHSPSRADQLYFASGDSATGRILSSSQDSVVLLASGDKKTFACSEVVRYRFSASDVVLFRSGERRELKLLRKESNDVVALSGTGVERLANEEIRRVWYNRGNPLETTIMAATGRAFINEMTGGVPIGNPRRTLAIGLRAGFHLAFLGDWKDQFVTPSGETGPSSELLQLGGEFTAYPSQSVFVGAGFEYLLGQQVRITNISGGGKDRPSAWLVFGTVGFGLSPRSDPDLRLGGAIDIGYLWAKEHMELSGRFADATGTILAVRPKFRGTYQISKDFLLLMEGSLLIARANNISLAGQRIEGYSLDFSGVSITTGIAFVTPF